jgi:hypothetical protein
MRSVESSAAVTCAAAGAATALNPRDPTKK